MSQLKKMWFFSKKIRHTWNHSCVNLYYQRCMKRCTLTSPKRKSLKINCNFWQIFDWRGVPVVFATDKVFSTFRDAAVIFVHFVSWNGSFSDFFYFHVCDFREMLNPVISWFDLCKVWYQYLYKKMCKKVCSEFHIELCVFRFACPIQSMFIGWCVTLANISVSATFFLFVVNFFQKCSKLQWFRYNLWEF